MGNDAGFADEKPVNTIYLDAFYLDQYEVTNRQYSDCVKSGVCQMPSTANLPDGYFNNYPVVPVVNVAWGMAKTYCEWRGGRLPTEAEWEKAARGGLVDMLYPWGNAAPSCNNGTLNGARLDECKGDGPIVVGSYQPNGYQLYDMIGNVSEWVNDWYASDYYALGPSISPEATGPSTGTKRVVRGGSWDQTHTIISVSARGKNTPETQSNQIGFRCARDTAP
jgi:formylglycine-generating enzyme required for sulfatase activity